MSFRKHPLSGEPILFAPGRAARPHAFGDDDALQRCPFCPGHESDTPAEIAHIGDPWRVRVFPNKYPPIEGAEVIVESPHHDATFDAIEHAEEVVQVYRDRLHAHREAEYVSLFKNEGSRAGASIPHTHSQVVPLPFLPPRIERELAGFAGGCPLCTPEGAVIRSTPSWTWLAPHGSSFAYQQWLVPNQHAPSLTDVSLSDLATLLRAAARATRTITPAFNWMLMNFPRDTRGHCYIEIVPRTAAIAGFELGTGMFVEVVDPAEAGRRLGD